MDALIRLANSTRSFFTLKPSLVVLYEKDPNPHRFPHQESQNAMKAIANPSLPHELIQINEEMIMRLDRKKMDELIKFELYKFTKNLVDTSKEVRSIELELNIQPMVMNDTTHIYGSIVINKFDLMKLQVFEQMSKITI